MMAPISVSLRALHLARSAGSCRVRSAHPPARQGGSSSSLPRPARVELEHDYSPAVARRSFASSSAPSSSEVSYDRHFIGGEWVPPSDSSHPPLIVHDSNTGLPFASVPSGSSADASLALKAASDAFSDGQSEWSRPSSLPRRMDAVRTIAESYDARRDEVASMLQRELGAPAKFAYNVQAALFKYSSDQFLKVAEDFPWEVDLGRSLVVKEPIGVVSAITPWNWPVWQIAAKVVPALLAGCSIVLKPSEVAPLNAFVLAEVVERAEADGVLPRGVFNLVSGTGPAVGEAMASHPLADMVSFTGSTNAGRRVHQLGASPSLKRVRSELGGKSACVVLDDADPAVVQKFALHVLENSGQTCSAHGRMIVPRDRYDEVIGIVKEAYEGVRVVRADDPEGKRGDIGPLSSRAQMERVRGYIQSGIEEGARLVTGGLDPPDDVPEGGYFVRPTIFADVKPNMKIAQEEIFGPVLCVMPYSGNVEEVVAIANGTEFGLSGAVLGADEGRARKVAGQLRTGEVFVNTLSQSPLAPFGGYNQSGDGRELGAWGLEEFLQVKAIHCRPQK